MAKNGKQRFDGRSFWSDKTDTLTAEKDLDKILGSAVNLPLRYWKPGFLFFGASDHILFDLTEGMFPRKRALHGTHPVYSLKKLPDGVGFKVCPCSSKRPFSSSLYRYIRKGCRLRYTGYEMDRNSYLLEKLHFPIPSEMAMRIRFKGQVPERCIETAGQASAARTR
ncbi:MAG: hypothetical protein JRH18_24130 [Deltaproteobacteria bacterium]|nr:hypothetical protein [Deltaproteobacteria bacterium]MBW2154737.1 hypothetical protein [Deltaproteobacteria bacterium]